MLKALQSLLFICDLDSSYGIKITEFIFNFLFSKYNIHFSQSRNDSY